MKWIPIIDALALIGGEAKKEPLNRALVAGDVKARLRTPEGVAVPASPRAFWQTAEMAAKAGKILWANGALDRHLILEPIKVARPCPYTPSIEVEIASLIEAFGPIEAPSAPAAPTSSAASRNRRWAGIDDAVLIAKMRGLIGGDRAQSVTAAATQLAPQASGNGTVESKAKRLQRKYTAQ